MLRILSLFSGIGAFEKALSNLKIEYELVNYCEIDKYASKAYALIHNCEESLNLGDITKIDLDNLPKNIDMITHGSPCQDFSVAGYGKGGDKNTNTRSSLLWNTIEIVKRTLPKYVIWENVPNVISIKHQHTFDDYCTALRDLGYVSDYKVLNACDYGIPQRRERLYCISIRVDLHKGIFQFPEPIPLETRLKDYLETNVDEKYFISEKMLKLIYKKWKKFRVGDEPNNISKGENIAYTLTTKAGARVWDNFIDCSENEIPIPCATKKGYEIAKDSNNKTNIRKLTPKECFRLMGFDDKDVDILQANGISDTQLFKMAGNSIVVNVLMAIFRNLLLEEKFLKKERIIQETLF